MMHKITLIPEKAVSVRSDPDPDELRELFHSGRPPEMHNGCFTQAGQDHTKTIPADVRVAAGQWYKTNKALYDAEVAAMRREFGRPDITPSRLPDGRLYWKVRIKPRLPPQYHTMTYEVALIYDKNHPCQCYGTSVHALLLSPTLKDLEILVKTLFNRNRIPHTIPAGNGSNDRYLCTSAYNTVSADPAKGITSAVTSYRLAVRWLTLFEASLRNEGIRMDFWDEGVI